MSSQAVTVINGINMVVSIGLLSLGIILLVYGFKINAKKCKPLSGDMKNCVLAQNYDGNAIPTDESGNVETLRLVALITGFLLILPFGLNLAEMVLTDVPGTDGVTGFLGKIGSTANQKAYNLKSRNNTKY